MPPPKGGSPPPAPKVQGGNSGGPFYVSATPRELPNIKRESVDPFRLGDIKGDIKKETIYVYLCSRLVMISHIEKWIPLGGNTKWKHFLTEH
jgi:hypothetical protein